MEAVGGSNAVRGVMQNLDMRVIDGRRRWHGLTLATGFCGVQLVFLMAGINVFWDEKLKPTSLWMHRNPPHGACCPGRADSINLR